MSERTVTVRLALGPERAGGRAARGPYDGRGADLCGGGIVSPENVVVLVAGDNPAHPVL